MRFILYIYLFVLNKADMIDNQQLMRVYGALMWSLGKVLNTPEVARVYIGSFWDKPFHYDTMRRLFELESQDLFKDLQSLPKNAALRKLKHDNGDTTACGRSQLRCQRGHENHSMLRAMWRHPHGNGTDGDQDDAAAAWYVVTVKQRR